MNVRKISKSWLLAGAVAFAALWVAGCATDKPDSHPGGSEKPSVKNTDEGGQLRVQDTIRVMFSNVSASSTQLPTQEEQIKEDGTITLPLVGSVQAAGRTTGDLQNELQKSYRKFYVSMNVTVTAPDRYYSVGGEVRTPKRDVYIGGTTVIKAIQSAGDFSEYADRKKVRLTRANGKTYIINCVKALNDPRLDLPVYPGDYIHVPKRWM